MAFDQMNISDMMCDMYDIQRQVKQAKLYDKPKDNNGSSITIGDCIENVIDQLEEELKRRIGEIWNETHGIHEEETRWRGYG